jgi:hypothetical protein
MKEILVERQERDKNKDPRTRRLKAYKIAIAEPWANATIEKRSKVAEEHKKECNRIQAERQKGKEIDTVEGEVAERVV